MCHGNNEVWPADPQLGRLGTAVTSRCFDSETLFYLHALFSARQDAVELWHLKTSLIHLCHLTSRAKANVGNFSATRARRRLLPSEGTNGRFHTTAPRDWNFVGRLGHLRQLSRNDTANKLRDPVRTTMSLIRHARVWNTFSCYLDNVSFPAPIELASSLRRTRCVGGRTRFKVADFWMESGCCWPCESLRGGRCVLKCVSVDGGQSSEQQQVQLTRVCSYCSARWSEPSPAMALLVVPPPPPLLVCLFGRLASTLARLRGRHPRRSLSDYLLSSCDTLTHLCDLGASAGEFSEKTPFAECDLLTVSSFIL